MRILVTLTCVTVNPGVLCSGMSVQGEPERGRRRRDAEDDGENTSSSSQEFEDVGLREEKALSDSEVKVSKTCKRRAEVVQFWGRSTFEPFDFAEIKGNLILKQPVQYCC